MQIDSIGLIVASEVHGSASWDGEHMVFWGRFDCEGDELRRIPIMLLVRHLIEAVPIDAPRPPGFIRCIGCVKPAPQP